MAFQSIFMKPGKSLLTHTAVFVLGAALIWVMRPSDSPQAGGEEASDSARRSSSRNNVSGSVGEDSRTGSTRSRRNVPGEKADGQSRPGDFPEARLSRIIRTGDPLERQAALIEMVSEMSPDQFVSMADQFRSMEHFGNSRGEFDIILRGWAKADPLGALEYAAKKHPDSRETSATIISAWAGNDPAAAEQWARENFKGEGANPLLAAVIRGVATTDLAQASRLVEGMPSSRERGEAIDAITRALFVDGVATALNYPATILDPELRAGFIDNIARRLATKDPIKAADWLASNPDADVQNRTARAVGEALARQDPTQAATWLRKLSPAAQAEAARGIIPRMSSGDITGTAQWVTSLNGIPNYDRVVEEFVWSCDQRAPEQSAAWIQGVANEEQRTRLYHRMLGEWARRDAAAVKNWIANNQVPESIIRRFGR